MNKKKSHRKSWEDIRIQSCLCEEDTLFGMWKPNLPWLKAVNKFHYFEILLNVCFHIELVKIFRELAESEPKAHPKHQRERQINTS